MKTYDLEYTMQGMFTFFTPITDAGVSLWNELAAQTDGTGKVLTAHLDATLAQMRKAGYSVRKAAVVKMSKEHLNDLYKELEEMYTE